jgi:hypothetical protein
LFYSFYRRQKEYKKLVNSQKFIRDRLVALGPDLAAAHFITARGCRVRLKGRKNWIGTVDGKKPVGLPTTYEPGFYVEAIDATDTVLVYEGLSSMRNLASLKYLDLSYSPLMDAWCMDRITGEYADSLEYLDISGCRSIDWNGLECIWRLYRLKTLVLRDMVNIV